ncbi:SH3 domain-containing protein, partial [uncultured Clostridium sp.]|uniref:SH3 domain-containing protein n=1 Tax=uncultured Clostridium sp. TaxID=59620 RepID=UPI0026047E8F
IGTGTVAFSDLSYTDIMSKGTWYSDVLGTLNNGTKVNIIGQNDNWFEIENGKGTAWIPKNRLSTSLGHTVIGTGTVAFSDLSYTDIMSKGTWYSSLAGTLNNGTKVNIIGQNDNWFEIENGKGTAWIPKNRLSTSLGHTVIGTGTVAFNDLSYTDIMNEGTWYSSLAGTLNNGTKINIIGQNENWYEIENGNGTAWIPKNRVSR